MFIGGLLIRRFDGFRRLCRRAAEEYRHPLSIPEEDMLLLNRVLAALGGPPAPAEVRGRLASPDSLPLLLLFLLTQEMDCRVGLVGRADDAMGRLKGLVHLLGHAVYPMVKAGATLPFQDVVKELGSHTAVLKPLVTYDDRDGEPTGIEPAGAAGSVHAGRDGGPYTLAVLLGEGAGPAPLGSPAGQMHPAVLVLG